MEQQFLQVWRDGQLWFEFPAENEDNVRLDLMKKGIDRVCDIRPKVDATKILKPQVVEIDLNEVPKPRKPKAEKATTHDIS